jgi:hypothetical protein
MGDVLHELVKAIESQEAAIRELADITEKQNETIGGLVLVVQALIDLLPDNKQREEHVARLLTQPTVGSS